MRFHVPTDAEQLYHIDMTSSTKHVNFTAEVEETFLIPGQEWFNNNQSFQFAIPDSVGLSQENITKLSFTCKTVILNLELRIPITH